MVLESWNFANTSHSPSITVGSSFTPALPIALIDSHETRTSSSVLPISKVLSDFASAGCVRGSCVSARNFMRSMRVLSSSDPAVYVLVIGSTMVSSSCTIEGSEALLLALVIPSS